MTATAAYSTVVKVSGVPAAVTNEATTSLGGGVYQVTNTARRIWDPTATITIKDGGVTVSSALWSFDYLFGKVTFSGYSPSGAITVDGSYLPTLPVAECTNLSVKVMRTVLDSTSYDSGGVKGKVLGLKDASGSVDLLAFLLTDLDGVTAGSQAFFDFLLNATPKLLEFSFGASTTRFRAWVLLESLEQSAGVDDLVKGSFAFVSAPRLAGAAFGFGT
jgi:hypothetical protein